MAPRAVVMLLAAALCGALQVSALEAPAPAPAAVETQPMAAPVLQTAAPAVEQQQQAPTTVSTTQSMQGRGPVNCVAKAQGIVGSSSSCKPVIDYLRPYGDSMSGADDAAVRKLVSAMPALDQECCYDLRDFIDDACMCDNRLINLLPLIRLSKSVLTTATRAIQASTCATAANGGAIYDPCTGTSGPAAGTGAARRLLTSEAS